MGLIALTIIALLVGQAFAYPLGFGVGFGGYGDVGFGSGYGGCGCCVNAWDVGCCGRGDWGCGGCDCGSCGGNWGCGGGDCGCCGGNGGCGGGDCCCDGGNWGCGGYGYPPSTTYARENYVRPFRGGPEFGTRREVTYGPGYYGGPYSPSYNWYGGYGRY